MREISEATLAILKSQNLTGQNRFSHSLKFEGVDFYGPISENKTNNVGGWGDYQSKMDYAILNNGKVLLTYENDANIFTKTINSVEELQSISGIGSGAELFVNTKISNFTKHALKRLKNGKLIFIVTIDGNNDGITPSKIIAYISNSGNADDFIEHVIYEDYTVYERFGTFDYVRMSNIIERNNGDIIFVGHSFFYSATYRFSTEKLYKTSDEGLTWTSTTVGGAKSGNGTLTAQSCLSINDDTGFIAYNLIYNYGNLYGRLCWSVDSGATWQYQDGLISNGQMVLDVDDKYIYLFRRDNETVYRMEKINFNKSAFDNINLWEIYKTGLSFQNVQYWDWFGFKITAKGDITIYGLGVINSLIRDEYSAILNASSISISKGKGGSNTATIQASNKDGALNPKNPDGPLYNILGTNKQIIIKQGYGIDLVETFTGMIDDFEMSTWPQTTNIALRDNLKKALDQTITDGNQHTVDFASQPIENIVGWLCYLANIEVGADAIEPTGISVAMNFSWCSYADAFQQLGDLASFEWGCDSYGKFYFRRDYQPDNMFVAYTFEEGIDIVTLKYKIGDKDLYSKVVVFGKSGDTVISYEAPFLDAALYNILPQKILKIDATEASTVGALRKIAERALSMMQSRTAVTNFTSIAIPWLEVGDFIGIYERSTGASSIYRLSDLSFNMDKDSFTMSGTAYYYGDSIVPGELPTDTATQIVAPTTNLIPEMTSNTAPSGVARASSIYTSNYEPWQAFNSHSDDYYWNSITNTGWIEYQFPEKTIVDKYMLKARQLTIYNDAMPRDWNFEGFDGEKWVVLDTQTGQTNWGVYQSRTYLFANTIAYSKYRLNASRNDGYMRLQLEQLAMYYGGGA